MIEPIEPNLHKSATPTKCVEPSLKLKESAEKVSDILTKRLNELEGSEPDIDVQLCDISKKISLITNVREQKAVRKAFNDVFYSTMFPIVGELYGRD